LQFFTIASYRVIPRCHRYLTRDRDRIYRSVVTRRLRAMGIRDKPAAPASLPDRAPL
jgi:hypothetical protein